MKTEQSTVYVADDGKTFTTEAECIAHEKLVAEQQKRMTRLKTYVVLSGFETVEGRGYAKTTYVISDAEMQELIQWCLDRYGQPLRPWYGDSYYAAWTINEWGRPAQSALDMIGKMVSSIGDTRQPAEVVFVSGQELAVDGLPPREFPWPRKESS